MDTPNREDDKGVNCELDRYWAKFHDSCAILPGDEPTKPCLETTRGHLFKSAHGSTLLELRKQYFSVRGIILWKQLLCDIVLAQCIKSLVFHNCKL